MEIIKKINKGYNLWELIQSMSVEELENVIVTAADSYYNTNVSLLTDEIYDTLVEKLKTVKPDSPVLGKIGAPIKGKKHKLPYWMGSMDKIKSDDKHFQKWIKEYHGPYVISDKLDGISCLLHVNKKKISLYTRGNGSYGQDISHLLDHIELNHKHDFDNKSNIAIRGELIISKINFEKYKKIMANGRNMVAGIVNSKPKSVNKDYAKDVEFIAYEIVNPVMKSSEQLSMIHELGLKCVFYNIYDEIDIPMLEKLLKKRKSKSIFEIDGLIVTDDNLYERNIDGNPPYSFAFKGISETAETKVVDVLWEKSKDGYLVPTVQFEKVNLSQADLEFTSGFNAKYIVDNKIGPGAILLIVRSGDVIPYILDVIKPAKKAAMPKNVEYDWDKNNVNIIMKDFENDKDVIIKRLTKFMKDIGTEFVSEGIIAKIVNAGYDNIFDILKMEIEDFIKIEGFQKTLATKVYKNIHDKIDSVTILSLMVGSNLFGRGFGKRKIKKILDTYPKIVDEYDKKDYNYWHAKLINIEGFDTISVDAFIDGLTMFQKFYKKFERVADVKKHISKVKKNGRFKDANIVFTGFRNKTWQDLIENEGGKNSNTVSKNTTLLVFKEGDENSSKYKKAVDLGIKKISKDNFEKKYINN